MSVLSFSLWCSSLLAVTYAKYSYETKYLEVPVDHFSFTNNHTFLLRYLVNDSYFDPKTGPIFFYTGSNDDIERISQNFGFLWELAPLFKALIIFTEHRYYGESLPFGNESFNGPQYYGYLTSEQALADFVDVIWHVRGQINKQSNHGNVTNSVIAFGCSYGGMLSAWMRMKYPATIEGAIASSAPIWQFSNMVPCNSFYQGVTKAFNSSSPACANNIRKSWSALDNVTSTGTGRAWMNEQWKLCDPIETTHDLDTLKEWLRNAFVTIAVNNYPYSTDYPVRAPANPVRAMCQYLKNASLTEDKDLLMGVFDAVSVYFNHTGNVKCLKWSQDSSSGIGIDGWSIQRCTEMVMPLCSNGKTDMFWPAQWDLQSYSDQCYKKYKVRPREFMAEKMYGGKDMRTATNMLFSNGMLDPGSSAGVTHATTPNITVMLILNEYRCRDLQAGVDENLEQQQVMRELYKQFISRVVPPFTPPEQSEQLDSQVDMC